MEHSSLSPVTANGHSRTSDQRLMRLVKNGKTAKPRQSCIELIDCVVRVCHYDCITSLFNRYSQQSVRYNYRRKTTSRIILRPTVKQVVSSMRLSQLR
jgi:hypothetical protein